MKSFRITTVVLIIAAFSVRLFSAENCVDSIIGQFSSGTKADGFIFNGNFFEFGQMLEFHFESAKGILSGKTFQAMFLRISTLVSKEQKFLRKIKAWDNIGSRQREVGGFRVGFQSGEVRIARYTSDESFGLSEERGTAALRKTGIEDKTNGLPVSVVHAHTHPDLGVDTQIKFPSWICWLA